uniref:Putative secreted protein n=1 Tax=Anopheles darlingi TaxID=43151 RepID=A0A2M4D4J9_ANODA
MFSLFSTCSVCGCVRALAFLNWIVCMHSFSLVTISLITYKSAIHLFPRIVHNVLSQQFLNRMMGVD